MEPTLSNGQFGDLVPDVCLVIVDFAGATTSSGLQLSMVSRRWRAWVVGDTTWESVFERRFPSSYRSAVVKGGRIEAYSQIVHLARNRIRRVGWEIPAPRKKGFLESVSPLLSQKPKYNFLLLGEPLAAKNAIFEKVGLGAFKQTRLGIGYAGYVERNGVTLTSWDTEAYPVEFYLRHCGTCYDALLYTIDSADIERRNRWKEEFHMIATDQKMMNCPILVLADRQDVAGAASVDKIAELFGLTFETASDAPTTSTQLRRAVQGAIAKDGKGIREALEWLKVSVDHQRKHLGTV